MTIIQMICFILKNVIDSINDKTDIDMNIKNGKISNVKNEKKLNSLTKK